MTVQAESVAANVGQPLITIGITCYNAADTISRAVDSAFAQDWPNKEVIVVDDASTDGSAAVLAALVERHPSLVVVRHGENRGYPGALNSIIERAQGTFVAIFDDDDASDPRRLEAQYRRIVDYEQASGENLVLCYSNRYVVKPGQGRPDHIAEAIGRRPPEPRGTAVAEYLFGYQRDPAYVWGMFGSCTLMARREVFRRVGAFDETFRRCAEWDFAVRAAFMGGHFIAVDEPLVTQHKTPSSDKAGKIALIYALQLRSKHRDYLRHRGVYLASRAIARANFYGSKGRRWAARLHLALALALLPMRLRPKRPSTSRTA